MLQKIKSAFVSLFASSGVALVAVAAYFLYQDPSQSNAWWGALIAGLGPVGFFAWVFTGRHARTPNRLWLVLAIGVIGTLVAAMLGGGWPALWASVVGVGGTLLYDYWYSRFTDRQSAALKPGNTLPDATLFDVDGKALNLRELATQPAVWMFYRGNWCPFCMAQIKEVVAEYQELERRGAKIILVSPQPETHTRNLAKRFDVPIDFLMDRDNAVARSLDIFVKDGLPTGMQALGYDDDVPMPTVFITDASGKVIYADLTSNYRIRPEPSEFLRVLDENLATAS